MLHDFGWDAPRGGGPSPARVMSFSYTALQRMERLAPAVPVVQLVDRPQYWPMLRRVIGADWNVGPGIDLLQENPKLAERIAGSGHDVHVWTVNTEPELRRCQELGVTAVITDRPAYLLELLER
jgi:glycerophosphoryl diester phosphodiesterase